MPATALSTVVLRLFAFFLLFQSLLEFFGGGFLFMGMLITQMQFVEDPVIQGIVFAVAWILRIGLLLFLYFKAPAISQRIFPDDPILFKEGTLEASALAWVGLILLGLHFFIMYLPHVVQELFLWFRSEAETQQGWQDPYHQTAYHFPIDSAAILILSLVLIFRAKTLAHWIYRVSK